MTKVLEEQHEKLTSELTGFRWQKVLLEQDLNVLSYKSLLEKIDKAEKSDYKVLLQEMRECKHLLVESEITNPNDETINVCYCIKCPFDTGFIDTLYHGKELTYLQRAQQQVYCQALRNNTVIGKDDYDPNLVRTIYKNIINSHPELSDTLAVKYVMAYLKNMSIKRNSRKFKARKTKRLGLGPNIKS